MSKARRRRALLRTVRYRLGLTPGGTGWTPSLHRRADRVWLDKGQHRDPWIWTPRWGHWRKITG